MRALACTGLAAMLALVAAGGVRAGARWDREETEASPGSRGRVTVTLSAAPFRIVGDSDGQTIQMDGFDELAEPGKPILPVRRFLVALPPGARARSVEVLSAPHASVPGTHPIRPYPLIPPPPATSRFQETMEDYMRAWGSNYDSVYQRDGPYPAQAAWLAGTGTLRNIAYASVAFSPFTFYPRSHALRYCGEAEVAIHYDLPPAGGDGESPAPARRDPVAEARAADLFLNCGEACEPYLGEASLVVGGTPGYRYIIVTTADLLDAVRASAFSDWKASLGFRVRTILTTDADIADQPGVDLAERIRNFLRGAYAAWGTEYLLLVGDYATVPMRICYPDPDFHVYDPGDPGLVAPGTPTDHYYADLSLPDSDSWDSDGDGYYGEFGQDAPDFLAELAVGRIPVNDPGRVTYTLDKIVGYERDTGTWKNRALQGGAILFFSHQDHEPYPFVDGATCLDAIERNLMGGRTVSRYSERAGLVKSPFLWPALTENSFTSAWGGGSYGTVNWSGHGWPNGVYRTIWQWDDGDGVPESSTGEMISRVYVGHGSPNLDDDHPSVLFAISCDVGYPDPNPYGNIGIDLLTLPGWGPSVGVVSASRPAAISSNWTLYPGGAESICYEFNRYLLQGGERVGDALYDGKFYATTHYGWDLLLEYMNLYNFNLFGDPSLAVPGARPLDEVTLFATKADGGSVILDWVGGAGKEWILDRSAVASFEMPKAIYSGTIRAATDPEPPSPVWYYRVLGDGR